MAARNSLTRAVVLFVLGLCSIAFRWLSLPSLFFCLVTLLTMPRKTNVPDPCRIWSLLWLSAIATSIGLTRFVYLDAVPGIVQAGEQSVMQTAVSHLREILRVEDALRNAAVNDADGDGIGSAALIGELAGTLPVRHGNLRHIPLNKRFQSSVDTPIGPAAILDGYAFIVCLRTTDGSYSARPNSDFDEESGEREFFAYAWPVDASRASFAIDAKDRILTRPNSKLGRPTYFGQLHPPDCAIVANAAVADGWSSWHGKKPRTRADRSQRTGWQNHDG
jgi:hypothetical protein